jgi:iron complex transport system ATP-binding protein
VEGWPVNRNSPRLTPRIVLSRHGSSDPANSRNNPARFGPGFQPDYNVDSQSEFISIGELRSGIFLTMTNDLTPPLIELLNVSLVRSGRTVLHELNLRIADGEHVAIMGPNGSGKSTLIKTITRELYPLYDRNSSMRLFGQETWNVRELRSMMGIVSNDFELFLDRPITGGEAVLSGFFGSVGLAWHLEVTAAMEDKTAELLEWLEIEHLADRVMGEMSSGEVRRVMIARALVQAPRALLLDEPSNSLDVSAQVELRHTMSKLAQSGIALLLITHHLPDVVPEIERVIFMREGRIFGDGPKAEMLTTDWLERLFGCPVQVMQQDGYYHMVS